MLVCGRIRIRISTDNNGTESGSWRPKILRIRIRLRLSIGNIDSMCNVVDDGVQAGGVELLERLTKELPESLQRNTDILNESERMLREIPQSFVI